MCNTWQYPSKKDEEVTPRDINKIPAGLKFANITGGEPFIRDDIDEIVSIVRKKTKRLVISTNGYFSDKIIQTAKENPDIGFRISLEGLPSANDDLRGIKDGFDRGIRTLLGLRYLSIKDIGFGITVSDRNAKDLIELYKLAKELNMEFATATVHNSYYFHKYDNIIKDKEMVIGEFKKLIKELLCTKKPKNWFRAYFNYGIVNYIKGNKRLLPCEVGTDVFFMDPYGEIRPCNGMEESMGNIKKEEFEQIWRSEKANRVRGLVRDCNKNCWMVGSAAPAIKKNIIKPAIWVIQHKFLKKELVL
jgi:MoaA/NifB/PqqE/SkfB family radical SAM enzyme